ncbi:hypothetical protein DSO57_1002308 [Entomophthora muscae]|uniref:Uncharacterized protein n=1 Tax=Entomophthora muscae TaxID=34485 RepID=A0ACC2UIJ0_9FUNG|nr:hypothetical protein DSO57_1002308 [Entomophthora muscae]
MAFEVLNAPPGSQPELAPILKSPSFNITLYLSKSMLYTLLKRNLENNKYQQLIFDGTLARLNKRKLRPCFKLPRDDKRTIYHSQCPKNKKKICYIDNYKCTRDNLKHHPQNRDIRSNTSLNTTITRSPREPCEYYSSQLALGIIPDLINPILNFFILNDHHSLLTFALALQAISLLALLCATIYHKWNYPQETTHTNLAKESLRPTKSRRQSI